MVRKILASVELTQNHGRHLDEYDSFWDDLHERIDDLEDYNLCWNLRNRKKGFWIVKEIMKRRR